MKSRARQQPATTPAPGRTAVAYVRVSSKEQEQGFSIPAQRQLLTEYAEREGLHVVQEFEDVETAKRAGRTAFGEMVAFLRKRRSTCDRGTLTPAYIKPFDVFAKGSESGDWLLR